MSAQDSSQNQDQSETHQEQLPEYHQRETIGTHFDTSESELIVSGALLFSLFQAPKLLQNLIQFALNNFDFDRNMIPLMTIIYLLTVISALQIAFIVHIGLRGFWIGTMGLFSVVPPNSGWPPEKYGAVGSRYFRNLIPTLPQLLKKSDQLASVTFSICILLVLILVYTTLMVVILGFVDIWVQSTLPQYGKLFRKLTAGLVISFSLASALISIMDKRMGKKGEYPEHSFRVRAIRAYYRSFSLIMPMKVYFPINKGLIDRFGISRLMSAIYALMGLAFVFTIVQIFSINGSTKFSDGLHPFYRTEGTQVLNNQFYEDEIDSDKAHRLAPSVNSAMIKTPYVRLFLPLHPNFNADLKELCPEAKGLNKWNREKAESEAMEQAVHCISSYFDLTLNGETILDAEFLFYQHKRRKSRGLVTFIPSSSLKKGSNLLKVISGLPESKDDSDGDKKPRTYHIYLWH